MKMVLKFTEGTPPQYAAILERIQNCLSNECIQIDGSPIIRIPYSQVSGVLAKIPSIEISINEE